MSITPFKKMDVSLPSTSTAPDERTEFELLLVIERYLSSGPFQKTASVLRSQIDASGIVPKRFDFKGALHPSSYHQFLKLSSVDTPCLLDLISRLNRLTNDAIPPSVKGLPVRLLAPPRNALERTKDSIFPSIIIRRMIGKQMRAQNTERYSFVKVSRMRELGVRARPGHLLSVSRAEHMERQYRIIGHSAPIYCLALDRTGQYALTGADDTLIKVWCIRTGLLRFTMRGHTGQIGDMTISYCNRFVASAGVDKTVRVWCLQTGAQIQVFKCHTATVTCLKWIPYTHNGDRWLVSTSYDCCINFYKWDDQQGKMIDLPIRISERDVPGMRLIALAHSPGGSFVAVGDSNSRIRMFKMAPTGPEKIHELTGHTDRVDSLVFSHNGLRLASGSKDGFVRLWKFSGQKWKHIALALNPSELKLTAAQLKQIQQNPNSKNKYKVMMLCWSLHDDYVITSGSDHVLRVWDSTNGEYLRSLRGHTADCYVLHSHPLHNSLLFTAGHDGMLMLWNIFDGRLVKKWLNSVDGQGNQALFDFAITDDGCRVAVVDQEGQISLYGIGTNQPTFKRPKTQFFSTDYAPFLADESGWVLDEFSGIPPHLMSPPLLTNGHSPYPDEVQRLVPGRDTCSNSDHLDCAWKDRQIVLALKNDEIKMSDERTNAIALQETTLFNIELHRDSDGEETPIENLTIDRGARRRDRALREQRIAEELERLERREQEEIPERERWTPSGDDTYSESTSSGEETARETDSDSDFSVADAREERRRDVHYDDQPNSLSERQLSTINRRRRKANQREYDREEDMSRSTQQRRRRSRRGRQSVEEQENEGEDDSIVDEADPQPSTSSAKPKRPRRPATNSKSNATEEDEEIEEQFVRPRHLKVVEEWARTFPEWMSSLVPKRFPYIAQVGDKVVYFRQGHESYLTAAKKFYNVTSKMWPKNELDAEEFAIVDEVKYTKRHYRLTCLKLSQTDESGQKTGVSWTVKYHDIDGIPDFLVLRHNYDESVAYRFEAGDTIEASLDNKWWTGTIQAREPYHDAFPRSNWFCLKVTWDTGEMESCSPWDLQPRTANRRSGSDSAVTEEEHLRLAEYHPVDGDWPSADQSSKEQDRDRECRRLREAICSLLHVPIMEQFVNPVNVNEYPEYPICIDYPSDLDTIAQRLRNGYYRRLRAVQHDLRYIAINAVAFNQESSDIVRNSRILVETMIRYSNDSSINTILPLLDEIVTLPTNELVEWKRRQRERNSNSETQMDTSQDEDISLVAHAPWILECKEVFLAVMRERCAINFRDRQNASQEMANIWNENEELPSLTDLINQLDSKSFQNPNDLIEKVNDMVQTINQAIDDNRSPIYRNCLSLGQILRTRLSPIVEKFNRLVEGSETSSRLRIRAGRTHGHDTRMKTKCATSSASDVFTSRSGRRLNHPQNGFYRDMNSGSCSRFSTNDDTSTRHVSPTTVESIPTDRPRRRSAMRRAIIESEDEDNAVGSPGRSRGESVISEESIGRRSCRLRKKPLRYDSESDESVLPHTSMAHPNITPTTRMNSRSRSIQNEEDNSDIDNQRREFTVRDNAVRRELMQEQQDLVDDMEEDLLSDENELSEQDSESGQETQSEPEDEEQESSDEEKATPHSTRNRRRRINESDEEEDENEDPSPVNVSNRNGRCATRSANNSSKRARIMASPPSGGTRRRPPKRREAVNYEESEDEMEPNVSSRGRKRRIRRFDD